MRRERGGRERGEREREEERSCSSCRGMDLKIDHGGVN